jgi:hypothetical protein
VVPQSLASLYLAGIGHEPKDAIKKKAKGEYQTAARKAAMGEAKVVH